MWTRCTASQKPPSRKEGRASCISTSSSPLAAYCQSPYWQNTLERCGTQEALLIESRAQPPGTNVRTEKGRQGSEGAHGRRGLLNTTFRVWELKPEVQVLHARGSSKHLVFMKNLGSQNLVLLNLKGRKRSQLSN